MSFGSGTQAELIYTLPASVTKNTYTTIAAITGVAGTNTICSMPPGWAINDSPNPVGRSLMLEVWGTIASLDPRVQQYVELFGTWSVSNASNTTTVQQMFLWGLN